MYDFFGHKFLAIFFISTQRTTHTHTYEYTVFFYLLLSLRFVLVILSEFIFQRLIDSIRKLKQAIEKSYEKGTKKKTETEPMQINKFRM